VTRGVSTQLEVDAVVRKAADKRAKEDAKKGIVEPEGATLEPASETGAVLDVEAHQDFDDHHEAEAPVFHDEDDDED
jgi:hypothetical protein